MKKLSVLLFAAALVLAFTLPAAALENEFGGYFRVRAYTDQNFSGTDNTSEEPSQNVTQADTRTRLYYTAKFSDTFQFVNKFEFNNTFGDTNGGDIGADGMGIFRIKNSYVDFWTFQKKLQWKIGIQGYTIARGFLFSDDFSGAYVAYNGDGWKIPFLWIKAYEGGQNGNNTNQNDYDVDYYVLNPAFGLGGVSLNPYFMYMYSDDGSQWNNTGGNGFNTSAWDTVKIWWLGVDADFKWENINFWGTFIWNGGSADLVGGDKQDVQAYLFGLGGSGAIGPFGLHGQFVYSSGDDNPNDDKIDSFINPRGASYYWSEIMGYGIFDNQVSANSPADQISNVWFVNGGADFKPIESLKLTLDVWYAALAEKEQIGASGNELGTEIDLLATWEIMPKLNLDVVGAYLFRGSGTYDGPDKKDPYELGTRLSLSF